MNCIFKFCFFADMAAFRKRPTSKTAKSEPLKREAGDEAAVALVLVALVACIVAWRGGASSISISFPPSRFILELSFTNVVSASVGSLAAVTIFLFPRSASLCFALAAAVLLPMPYLVPAGTFTYASPTCALALALFILTWKLFDIAIGTAPRGITSSLWNLGARLTVIAENQTDSAGMPMPAAPGEWRHHARAFVWRALGSAALSSAVALAGPALPYLVKVRLSLYTILPCTLLYGVWHGKRGVGRGSNIAQECCNSIATVWAMQVGGAITGVSIRAQKPRSERISGKGQGAV